MPQHEAAERNTYSKAWNPGITIAQNLTQIPITPAFGAAQDLRLELPSADTGIINPTSNVPPIGSGK